jgi:2'-5' RNA ligase
MSMRCFVGIPMPEEYQRILERITEAWRGSLSSRVSWTKKGNWHLTLFFLGDVEEATLAPLRESLAGVRMPAFAFQASGGGFFPPGKRPRVIWAGVRKGAQECGRLASMVESAVHPLGFVSDKQEFRPHLTLGRIKQAKRDDWSALLGYLNRVRWPEVTIDSFVLWQSTLKASGPEYSALERYPLQGPASEA